MSGGLSPLAEGVSLSVTLARHPAKTATELRELRFGRGCVPLVPLPQVASGNPAPETARSEGDRRGGQRVTDLDERVTDLGDVSPCPWVTIRLIYTHLYTQSYAQAESVAQRVRIGGWPYLSPSGGGQGDRPHDTPLLDAPLTFKENP
jgi:hypothetical protein